MASTPAGHDPVRAQYENWVYPQPIADLSDPAVQGIRDRGDPAIQGYAYWPDRPARGDLHILVAGCGPNTAARYAFHHPKATVVGVDLSETSLAHAQYLKQKHDLRNLSLHQCRVEDIERLGQTFDLIDCSGVLHHLPHPEHGIKGLSAVLRSDGVMTLMLYAPYGRAGVYMLRGLFRLLRLTQSPADASFVRQALSALKADHAVQAYLADSPDLYFDAGLVDTFLHRVDRAYTVGECRHLVEGAGLVVQGWLERFFYYPEGQISRQHPLFARIDGLDEPQIWEAMELYHGRISTHRFFACKRGRDVSTYRISFSGKDFMNMVPLPRADLQVAAAANMTVALERPRFPRMLLAGDHAAIFRQVDGRRTIAECVKDIRFATADPVDFCRAMFKELWRLGYVHLVFPSAVQANTP